MTFIARALCALALLLPTATTAMVGGAAPAGPALARHVVMLVGSRGTSCSGVAITRDLVLTAGHCVEPGAEYRLVDFAEALVPVLKEIAAIARHPQFEMATLLAHRATADVALLKLTEPLPARFTPAPLTRAERIVMPGDAFTVAGIGVAVRGDGKSGGTVRAATLVATGQPGALQIRLFDPATKGESAGLGACTGDSGAPAFDQDAQPAVIGIVSWSTGPKLGAGCGGLTGVTPLARYRAWIADTARAMGSPLP